MMANLHTKNNVMINDTSPMLHRNFQSLFERLTVIGWRNVKTFEVKDGSFRIVLSTTDNLQQEHTLLWEGECENLACSLKADLPISIVPQNKMSFDKVYELFKVTVEQLHDFWSTTHLIDTDCLVLEPTLPCPRSATFRRVYIGKECSVGFHLKVPDSKKIPSDGFEFWGPEEELDRLRWILKSNMSKWNPNQDFTKNLAIVCDLEQLPRVMDNVKVVDAGEGHMCAVCFDPMSLDVSGAISCSNERCEQMFHEACLREWFQSLPGCSIKWSRLMGPCPGCKESLMVPLSTSTW